MYKKKYRPKYGRSYNAPRKGYKKQYNRGYSHTGITRETYISEGEKYVPDSIYNTDKTFDDFNLNNLLKNNINNRNYKNPTKIQSIAIPEILNQKDILAIASTGSGKTASFLIPLINKNLNDSKQRCLIIVPTRELAHQIQQELRQFTKNLGLRDVVIIGGASMRDQIMILNKNPQFVIATPGRLLDLYKRNKINLASFNNVVLDEVDRMLDMGFVHDIKTIISKLNSNKHTMFFSATLNNEAETIANSILKNPAKIQIAPQQAHKYVDQNIVRVKGSENKVDVLHKLLIKEEFEKVLIFSRTKKGADIVSYELKQRGLKTDSLHGDKPMGKRTKVLKMFKQGDINILVATDVASRGIDVPDITHVINYDEPATKEDYIHRIGRTGRIGRKGVALTFVK